MPYAHRLPAEAASRNPGTGNLGRWGQHEPRQGRIGLSAGEAGRGRAPEHGGERDAAAVIGHGREGPVALVEPAQMRQQILREADQTPPGVVDLDIAPGRKLLAEPAFHPGTLPDERRGRRVEAAPRTKQQPAVAQQADVEEQIARVGDQGGPRPALGRLFGGRRAAG